MVAAAGAGAEGVAAAAVVVVVVVVLLLKEEDDVNSYCLISVDSDPRRENPPYLLQTPKPISGWHRHT